MSYREYGWYRGTRLYKDRESGVIMGVCAGLADYFDTSMAVTRLIALAALYFFFIPTLLVYVIVGFLLKDKRLTFRGSRGEARFWARCDSNTAGR